jgi:predicted transcriptional regulator
VKNVKKIGPLSIDLVVACKIYEFQKNNAIVEFGDLVSSLNGVVSKSAVSSSLITLSNWGIIGSEFCETKSGRAGRVYSISGEAFTMVKETYEQYWQKVLQHSTL